jgi:hypothetical protein
MWFQGPLPISSVNVFSSNMSGSYNIDENLLNVTKNINNLDPMNYYDIVLFVF